MNNAVTRKLLLLAVLLHAAFCSPADVKPCDVSLFAESWIVVMGKYGITWVDGNQESLEYMNTLLDVRLMDQSHHTNGEWMLRGDTAKLFYTANYSHLLAVGIKVDEQQKNRFVGIGLLDTRYLGDEKRPRFRKYQGDLIKPDNYGSNRFCWDTGYTSWYGLQNTYRPFIERNRTYEYGYNAHKLYQFICDANTISFIPSADQFAFDNDKTMSLQIFGDFPTYKSKTNVYPDGCPENTETIFRTISSTIDFNDCTSNDVLAQIAEVPKERVADFNNKLDRKLQDELEKEIIEEDFFYNQLESGKFKLQAELFTDEKGIEWYYHILTMLNPYEIMQEEEKCYIRKFKKEKVNDKYSIKDQPIEFPRMLLIPKEAGPKGVPIQILTTPAPVMENATLFYPTVPFETFANATIATAITPTPEFGSASITTASLLLFAAVCIANY